jgi:hypothetical protein
MGRRRTKLNRRRLRKTRRRQRGGEQPLVYDCSGAKIKVFVSADRMEPTLDALLSSLKKHKYSYEVLGFGKPWKGFKTKMENYLDGINRYNDGMAIFVDAFDVLCIKDSDKVLQTYTSRSRKMPVVVGAEIICFYEDNCSMDALNWFEVNNMPGGRAAVESALTKPEPERPYYESPKPVFTNSGFIMGPAQELKTMFQSMMDSGDTDDQIAVIHYMTKAPDKIDLDIEEAMIRNKLKPRTKLADEDGQKGPGFVHFPGTRTKEEQKRNVTEYYSQYPK